MANQQLVDVIPLLRLPAEHPGIFTYRVPEVHAPLVHRGAFVRIPFRAKRIWAVVVHAPSQEPEHAEHARSLLDVRTDALLTDREINAVIDTANQFRVSPATVAYLVLPRPPSAARAAVQPASSSPLPSRRNVAPPSWVVKFLCQKTTVAIHRTSEEHDHALRAVVEEVVGRRHQSVLLITPQRVWIPGLDALLSPLAPVIHLNRTEGHHAQWHVFVATRTQPCVIIGTRPAAYIAPNHLGAIILDHASSDDHKQYDAHPRYDARMITALHGVPRLFLTVAPRVEDWANANSRVQLGSATGPVARTVDLTEYWRGGGKGLLTPDLLDAIRHARKQEQLAIVLHNRRGRMARIRCRDCSVVVACPTCAQPLAEHDTELRCRRCTYATPTALRCPSCASPNLSSQGLGTMRVVALLHKKFPDAQIDRIDGDSKTLPDLSGSDILVASERFFTAVAPQCIRSVGVVGMVHAERFTRTDDYRANEQLFLALRTIGYWSDAWNARCVIQTGDAEAPPLRAFRTGDCAAFYREEIAERTALHYPPATRLIRCSTQNADAVLHAHRDLQQWIPRGTLRSIEGPYTTTMNGVPTSSLILKCPSTISSTAIKELTSTLTGSWTIDVDPIRIHDAP